MPAERRSCLGQKKYEKNDSASDEKRQIRSVHERFSEARYTNIILVLVSDVTVRQVKEEEIERRKKRNEDLCVLVVDNFVY
jgi:hypothetical protein